MDVPEVIRAKKRKVTGDVWKEVKSNKNSGSPYHTLKNKRLIPGRAFGEEVSESYLKKYLLNDLY